jgi:hypothetical protein
VIPGKEERSVMPDEPEPPQKPFGMSKLAANWLGLIITLILLGAFGGCVAGAVAGVMYFGGLKRGSTWQGLLVCAGILLVLEVLKWVERRRKRQ